MPVPSMRHFFVPCLRLLSGTARNASDCLAALQNQFQLTEAEMAEMIPSGTRTRVFDRADWAIFHLMRAGLVDRPERGVYRTSLDGKRLLESGVSALTLAQLKAMPAYVAALSALEQDGPGTAGGSRSEGEQPGPDQSPEEQIARAHAELDAALRAELMELVIALHPVRFERLIIDLLNAMGYGAGDLAKSMLTRASGDGGIDGIIHEDALGLDAVYIQAKRYAPGSNVGRPAIQQFVGSLTGEGATKGVFVTTSDFSAEARAYLGKVQHRIVLINGAELARLMIRHGVGVRPRSTYVIKGVDEDYFAEVSGL